MERYDALKKEWQKLAVELKMSDQHGSEITICEKRL
jgi:hypothetical protein